MRPHAQHSYDLILCFTIALLVLIGIVMVFSSSAVYAMEEYGDSYYFLKRHIVWVILGTGARGALCGRAR